MKLSLEPKSEFKTRIEELLGKEEAKKFFDIPYTQAPPSIRCNTLKISPQDLAKRLRKYKWHFSQPFKHNPEVFIIKSKLGPGELGKTNEHLLGYYYVQDISSMLPPIVLDPKEDDIVLDLCASPGSKTTQIAAMMKNYGTIIANDVNVKRISILNANLERCGVSNTIVTRKDGVALCNKIYKRSTIRFDKILVDAPCSGEGTLRKSPKTLQMWNPNMIKKLSSIQKRLTESAIKVLKPGGILVYSTCTLSPEENEFVIEHLIKNFDVKVEKINLPLKFRSGITRWKKVKLLKELKNCARIYPHDNNTEGFFLTKLKKIK